MIEISILTKRIQVLDSIIARKQAALKNAPAGALQVNPKGNQAYFDLIKNGCRRHLKVTDKKDQSLARALAQRAYDERVLRTADKERSALARLVKLYDNGCAEDCYDKLNRARQQLVTPIRLPDELYVARWQARDIGSKLAASSAPFATDRGDQVRSKSEMLIANKLYTHGIPYFYEPAIVLTDHKTGVQYTAHPDYLVLNTRSRKELCWEHLGMMDNADYVNQNLRKLRDYENAGYHPGDSLITTYETLKTPLDSNYINQIIRQYLL